MNSEEGSASSERRDLSLLVVPLTCGRELQWICTYLYLHLCMIARVRGILIDS